MASKNSAYIETVFLPLGLAVLDAKLSIVLVSIFKLAFLLNMLCQPLLCWRFEDLL